MDFSVSKIYNLIFLIHVLPKQHACIRLRFLDANINVEYIFNKNLCKDFTFIQYCKSFNLFKRSLHYTAQIYLSVTLNSKVILDVVICIINDCAYLRF